MRKTGFLQRLLCLCCAVIVLASILPATPAPAQPQPPSYATYPLLPSGYRSIKVFDRQSRFVGRLLPDKRYWVTIDRIPLFLQQAVVAVEDARFYEHGGIDLRGIARAAVKDVVKRRLAEGGSTITQQLIKNRYLSSEKTIDRKLREGVMALEFEKQYTKRQILEMYLNEIYYGNGAWGIAQAALLYFDKTPEQLSDAECALLAGVPKNPGRYNPLGKPAEAGQRRAVVLKRMVDVGLLSNRQMQQVLRQPTAPVPRNQAPYYLAHLRSQLAERYGSGVVEQGGLEVTAALDLPLQLEGEKVIREGAGRIAPQLQGALVALDPVNGDLLAAVGGTNFTTSPYNRAFQARRQPGSAIKPLIYAAALEQGITAASRWDDGPVSYPRGNGQVWQPRNYGNKQHGSLTLRQALASSNNVIAVKLLDTIGIPAYSELAVRLGLLPSLQDLSLALGTDEVTLHDLTLAYAAFANNGNRPQSRSIIRIYDSYRKSWTEQPPESQPALSPESAYIATQLLKEVLVTGTAKSLNAFSRQHPAAGKTGTTNDYRDAWFIGYTPRLAAGVWLGFDQPRTVNKGFTGGAVAAPLWERFMRTALAQQPAVYVAKPETVAAVRIDPASGLLAGPDCPLQYEEYFVCGSEPTDYCPLHGSPPAVTDDPAPTLTEEPEED